MQDTMGAVDYVKVEITSGKEIQYVWQDKLHKHNYFATYTLLSDNSFIQKTTLCITINITFIANVDMSC